MLAEALDFIVHTHRIAYALADESLMVQEVFDPTHLWSNSVKLPTLLFTLSPELEGQEDVLRAVLAAQLTSFDLQWVSRTGPDGATIYVNLATRPRRNSQGVIIGLLHVVEDVTAQGQLQQTVMQQRNELRLARDELARANLALQAANAELRRLDTAKSMFVSIAAHELRTPLSAIIGYADALLQDVAGPLNEQQQRLVHIVQHSANRLLRITNDLLDLARIEAGRLELLLRPTHLPTLVQAVLQELEPQLQAKRLAVTLETAADLPLGLVDEMRCQQIITNLVSNAIKYTPAEGAIAVRVEQASEPGFLQVTVHDSGVGIAAEDQAHIFDRFFRTDAGRLIDASGAGLGLHITRALVELHGGRIGLASAVGQGTTIWATFPVLSAPAQETQ